MLLHSRIGLTVALLVVSGCSVTFTKTGTAKFPPREPNCEFSIFTTAPQQAFDELGLIEISNGFSGVGVRGAQAAKELAAPHVCKAGGNGLMLWEADMMGRFNKGTVIRTK